MIRRERPRIVVIRFNGDEGGVVVILVQREKGRRDFDRIERVVSTDKSNRLAERYIAEGIVGKANINDSRHVALAAVAGVDVLVSFNCTHIVKLNRIHKYNAINVLYGYSQIEIRTPDEVIQ